MRTEPHFQDVTKKRDGGRDCLNNHAPARPNTSGLVNLAVSYACCLADSSLTGQKMALALSQVISASTSVSITVDNRNEFASKAMDL